MVCEGMKPLHIEILTWFLDAIWHHQGQMGVLLDYLYKINVQLNLTSLSPSDAISVPFYKHGLASIQQG